jgi:hypothetical protein
MVGMVVSSFIVHLRAGVRRHETPVRQPAEQCRVTGTGKDASLLP